MVHLTGPWAIACDGILWCLSIEFLFLFFNFRKNFVPEKGLHVSREHIDMQALEALYCTGSGAPLLSHPNLQKM